MAYYQPNFKKEINKPFYAVYLNMAKQNAFVSLRDISEHLGLGFNIKEDSDLHEIELWRRLESGKNPALCLAAISQLEKRFPFASILASLYSKVDKKFNKPEPQNYAEAMKSLLELLLAYRNYFTHAAQEMVAPQKSLIWKLQDLFKKSRDKLKNDFDYLREEDLRHLVRLGVKNGKPVERKDFKFGFLSNEEFTEKGFLFFVCLWLSRSEAQIFLTKHFGFKRSTIASERATLDAYTIWSIRPPKPKLKSDNSIQGLVLDMANELNRCPKPLYAHLQKSDRDKFVVEECREGNEITEVNLVRHSNRFYYLAMRYFDEVSEQMKFQVDLGNYCFHAYTKEIEGEEYPRRWIKRITAFGKLIDFKTVPVPNEWQEKVQKIEDRALENTDIYVSDTTPHYHINNMNIGIKFIENYIDRIVNNKLWPQLPDFDPNNKSETKAKNQQPDCWLSLYELPSMLFYQFLFEEGYTQISPENIIRRIQSSLRKFFSKVLEGEIEPGISKEQLNKKMLDFGLTINQCPKAILNYLCNKQNNASFEHKAAMRLKTQLTDTEVRLNKLDLNRRNYDSPPHSKDYIDIKCGNMGDFLARDMLMLQRPLDMDKGKANSTQFQILQAKLAYFGKYKDELHLTFKSCNLIEAENNHPFLSKINIKNCTGILDFYEAYLKEKKAYIKDCQKKSEYHNYHFLGLNEIKCKPDKTYISGLVKKFTAENNDNEKVITNLPRGMFLEPIMDALNKHETTQKLVENIKTGRYNTTYVIEQFFKHVHKDAAQEFYSYKRTYPLLDKLFDKRKHQMQQLKQEFYTVEELAEKTRKPSDNSKNSIVAKINERVRADLKKPANRQKTAEKIHEKYHKLYKQFTENEKQIRLYKNCDLVMFMLMDSLLRKGFLEDNKILKPKRNKQTTPKANFGLDYTLKNTSPENKSGLLALQTQVEVPVGNKVVFATVKIKDHGLFRGVLKDRCIATLLPYTKENKIDYRAIKQELAWYNEARLLAFESILNFEKEAAKIKDIPINADSRKSIHNTYLNAYVSEESERFQMIKELRNGFCHGMYPDINLFKEDFKCTGFNDFANYTSENQSLKEKSPALRLAKQLKMYYDELLPATV